MGSRTINMTTGSPLKHILNFAFPLILTNVGQQLYMIADDRRASSRQRSACGSCRSPIQRGAAVHSRPRPGNIDYLKIECILLVI